MNLPWLGVYGCSSGKLADTKDRDKSWHDCLYEKTAASDRTKNDIIPVVMIQYMY